MHARPCLSVGEERNAIDQPAGRAGMAGGECAAPPVEIQDLALADRPAPEVDHIATIEVGITARSVRQLEAPIDNSVGTRSTSHGTDRNLVGTTDRNRGRRRPRRKFAKSAFNRTAILQKARSPSA